MSIGTAQGFYELRAVHFTGGLAGRDQDSQGTIVATGNYASGISNAWMIHGASRDVAGDVSTNGYLISTSSISKANFPGG
jgi:hypothetical protein